MKLQRIFLKGSLEEEIIEGWVIKTWVRTVPAYLAVSAQVV